MVVITTPITVHICFTFSTEAFTHPVKITAIVASFIFHVPSAQRIILYMMFLVLGTTYLYIIKKGKWKKGKKKKNKKRADRMTQWVEMLAAKPDDPRSILRKHMREGQN